MKLKSFSCTQCIFKPTRGQLPLPIGKNGRPWWPRIGTVDVFVERNIGTEWSHIRKKTDKKKEEAKFGPDTIHVLNVSVNVLTLLAQFCAISTQRHILIWPTTNFIQPSALSEWSCNMETKTRKTHTQNTHVRNETNANCGWLISENRRKFPKVYLAGNYNVIWKRAN